MATATPLSDLMRAFSVSRDGRDYARFLEHFWRNKVGVIVNGVPEGTIGYFKRTDEVLTMAVSANLEGRSVILAFADPRAFALQYGQQFNCLVPGTDVITTVASNPSCHGIRVNSALEELSVLIDRETVLQLDAENR